MSTRADQPKTYEDQGTAHDPHATGHELQGRAKRDVFVMQDGADFYMFATAQNFLTYENMKETVTYPRKVGDFDTSAAHHARQWFIHIYCKANNIYPKFPTIPTNEVGRA